MIAPMMLPPMKIPGLGKMNPAMAARFDRICKFCQWATCIGKTSWKKKEE
jgi:hypothetical protein